MSGMADCRLDEAWAICKARASKIRLQKLLLALPSAIGDYPATITS